MSTDGQLDKWQEDSQAMSGAKREELEAQGVIFCHIGTALRDYPDLVEPYFDRIVPPNDTKLAWPDPSALSGGSFLYVPNGVAVKDPLQSDFGSNAKNMGRFERTLIIADEGSKVHYIEGCSSPVYSADSMHNAVVEVIVKPSAQVTYTTIQNWSSNVINSVSKQAHVGAEGYMAWVDANIGSRQTQSHPAVLLAGPKATGEVLAVAYAGAGQHQDTGAKMVHAAPETTSKILSKLISSDGGSANYRAAVRVEDKAYGCTSQIRCEELILDAGSISKTRTNPDIHPGINTEIDAPDAQIGHETTVRRIDPEHLFYLMSRGLSREQAVAILVNGFIEPVTRTLPMEYAVEWSRLIELQMEGSVG